MKIITALRLAITASVIAFTVSAASLQASTTPTITGEPTATIVDIDGTFNVDAVHGHSTYDGGGFIAALTGSAIAGGGIVFADESQNPFSFTLDLDRNTLTAVGLFNLIVNDDSAGEQFTGELFGVINDFDFDNSIAFGTITSGDGALLAWFGGKGSTIASLFNLYETSTTEFQGDAEVSAAVVPAPTVLSLLVLGLAAMLRRRRA